MPQFQDEFEDTNFKPIFYKGSWIHLTDMISVKNVQRLKITVIDVNSDYLQGACFETNGTFEANDQVFENAIAFWSDTAPKQFVINVNSESGNVKVYNRWDYGDGVIHSRHNGAAMIIEEIPNGRRYRCNDGYPDEDFDDIIFSVEWVNEVQ